MMALRFSLVQYPPINLQQWKFPTQISYQTLQSADLIIETLYNQENKQTLELFLEWCVDCWNANSKITYYQPNNNVCNICNIVQLDWHGASMSGGPSVMSLGSFNLLSAKVKKLWQATFLYKIGCIYKCGAGSCYYFSSGDSGHMCL